MGWPLHGAHNTWTGTRNICPDSRSSPPNTHWPLTGWPLWYFRWPNLLVNFDSLIRTTDLGRVALQVNQHNFPAEHAPVSNSMRTEAIFTLDLARWFAAHYVIRKTYCFEESKSTLLEPGSVPDRQRPLTPDNSIPRGTSPTKTIRALGVCLAQHKSPASITQHLTPNVSRPVGNWWQVLRHLTETWKTICSDHRYPETIHVRKKIVVRLVFAIDDPCISPLLPFVKPYLPFKHTYTRFVYHRRWKDFRRALYLCVSPTL